MTALTLDQVWAILNLILAFGAPQSTVNNVRDILIPPVVNVAPTPFVPASVSQPSVSGIPNPSPTVPVTIKSMSDTKTPEKITLRTTRGFGPTIATAWIHEEDPSKTEIQVQRFFSDETISVSLNGEVLDGVRTDGPPGKIQGSSLIFSEYRVTIDTPPAGTWETVVVNYNGVDKNLTFSPSPYTKGEMVPGSDIWF